MQAITTKFHSPTNTRGARISATSESGHRVMIGYPHELSDAAVHAEAVKALCAKLGWHGKLACGATKTGFVFVFVEAGEPLLEV